MNPPGAGGDRRERHFRRRHCKVGAVVLAKADEIDAEVVGQHRLVHDVADHLRVRQQLTVSAGGDVAEGINSKFKLLWHHALSVKVRAFSSEVDTGSREENASKQKDRASVLIPSEWERL